LSQLPGVVSAAAVLNLPLRAGGYDLGRGFIIPGQPYSPGGHYAQYQVVTPNYFKTLGVPLLQGRHFSQDDITGRPSVVIVNSTLARAWFGAANPIGKLLHDWRDEPAPREIIGVVGDVKTDLDRAAGPAVFVPLSQSPWDDMTFVVRTSLPVSTQVRRMTTALKETDPSQVAYGATTFDEILTATLARQRTGAVLFALFATAGMLLAAVGVYSVMAFAVNDRTREMGLRLALGAQPADVRRLFVLYGVKLLAAGLLAGSIASAVGGRILGRLLYGTGTGFASTATAIAAVAAIGLVSACVPIRRATAADPATILRGD
jgi:putative ABC transport system permease protein